MRHYRQTILSKQGDRSNVWTRSRFGKIKSIFNYAKRESNMPTKDRENLTLLELLQNPKKPKGDEKIRKTLQIAKDELEAMLKIADDIDRAAILIGLNCAYYQVDLIRLEWRHIDLTTKTVTLQRNKSSRLTASQSAVPRVAYLWQRTIDAIKKLKGSHKNVFYQDDRHTIFKRFRRLMKLAKLARKELTFANLRDSAITVASRAGVPTAQVHALAGHSDTTVTWEYIERSPDFVKDACEAIEKYYFG